MLVRNRIFMSAMGAFACAGFWFFFGGIGLASAHAEFGQSAVTAGSTSVVTLYVPAEYPGYFNVQVRIQIPNGWQAAGASGNVLTFSNPAGLGEEFAITLTAPASSGPVPFPVVQTYNAPLPGGGHSAPCNQAQTEICWFSSATLAAVASPSAPSPAPISPIPTPGAPTVTPPPSKPAAGEEVPSTNSPESSTDGPTTVNNSTPDPSSLSVVEASPEEHVNDSDDRSSSASLKDDSSRLLPVLLVAVVAFFALFVGSRALRRKRNRSAGASTDTE